MGPQSAGVGLSYPMSALSNTADSLAGLSTLLAGPTATHLGLWMFRDT